MKAIAWKAQHRLYRRYAKLAAKGKPKQKVVTAVARELLGFVWAVGCQIEAERAALSSWQRAAACSEADRPGGHRGHAMRENPRGINRRHSSRRPPGRSAQREQMESNGIDT